MKSYSLILGYRNFEGHLDTSRVPPVLMLEGHGPVTPMEFLKNQFYVLKAAPGEIERLRKAGYDVRIDTHGTR